MICQFSFKNFKSYRDETVFDMQAVNTLSEYKESLIYANGGGPLLPVSAIYGPNGGGKSTLLEAISCLLGIVIRPVFDMKKTRTNTILQGYTECVPFLLDDNSKNEPTEFNIYFRNRENEFRYYIAVKNDYIESEYMYVKTLTGKRAAMLFEREKSKIRIGSKIAKKIATTNVNPKMPFFSFLAINHDISYIAEAQHELENCIYIANANPYNEIKFPMIMLNFENESKNELIHRFNDVGIDISGYRIDNETKELYTQRTLDGNVYELNVTYESDGTKKMLQILPIIITALAEGRTVIIDELDSKLHPKLLKYIISLFTDSEINKNGAQLIFTSHDMSTLNNDVFRRDEVWFASRNDTLSSEIYSLSDIRDTNGKIINKTASYDKQYLEGRYGSDPYLSTMLSWKQ